MMETKISGFFFELFTLKNFIIVVITPIIALIPDFIYIYVRKLIFLDDTEVIRKIESGSIKNNFITKSSTLN
jgi:hypothetical protein